MSTRRDGHPPSSRPSMSSGTASGRRARCRRARMARSCSCWLACRARVDSRPRWRSRRQNRCASCSCTACRRSCRRSPASPSSCARACGATSRARSSSTRSISIWNGSPASRPRLVRLLRRQVPGIADRRHRSRSGPPRCASASENLRRGASRRPDRVRAHQRQSARRVAVRATSVTGRFAQYPVRRDARHGAATATRRRAGRDHRRRQPVRLGRRRGSRQGGGRSSAPAGHHHAAGAHLRCADRASRGAFLLGRSRCTPASGGISAASDSSPASCIPEISRVSSAPVYGYMRAGIGQGVVGGAVVLPDDEAVATSQLIMRVLRRRSRRAAAGARLRAHRLHGRLAPAQALGALRESAASRDAEVDLPHAGHVGALPRRDPRRRWG